MSAAKPERQLAGFADLPNDAAALSGCLDIAGGVGPPESHGAADNSDPTGSGQTLNWGWFMASRTARDVTTAPPAVRRQTLNPQRKLIAWMARS